jgi:hypothetical protein
MGEVPKLDSSFDEFGDYKHRVIVQHLAYFQRQDSDLIDDVIDQCTPHNMLVCLKLPYSKRHFKSPNPALNMKILSVTLSIQMSQPSMMILLLLLSLL